MSERTRIRGVAQREPARPRRAEGAAVLALQPAPGPRPAGERWEDSQATVAVRGELDHDALWAVDYTIGRASLEAGRIVLDLREVTHLDYAGVPELVARRGALRARGGGMGGGGGGSPPAERPPGAPRGGAAPPPGPAGGAA